MGKTKMNLKFEGLKEIAYELDAFPGALIDASAEALEKSAYVVDEKLHKEMKKHDKHYNDNAYGKGKTESTILDDEKASVEFNFIEMNVGFDIAHGGLPSIFLMYGTPRHYQPNMKRWHPGIDQDKALYNAVKGAWSKKKVKDLQREIFENALKKVGGHWDGRIFN